MILPQAGRRMIPAFTNRAVELAKMTSIASVITVPELMYQAKMLAAELARATRWRPTGESGQLAAAAGWNDAGPGVIEEGWPLIEFENLHKSFGPTEVLKGLDLTVGKGELHRHPRLQRIGENDHAAVVFGR
ncbi:hypothetical protein [Paracoccus mutanolyticus]|uniref:hypothetical protein n=1 Tax=Paracoccus mutanolyticus TaxID=1499308 RepID=UPI0016758CD9|nr:hypothetical protein [Paracoccus mutanolyticus]